MYDFFSRRAVASVLNRKSIPYLDRSYADKRRILREYSIKDEIRDFVSTVCDEAIIYSDKDFCRPKNISNDYSQDIRDKYQEYFEKVCLNNVIKTQVIINIGTTVSIVLNTLKTMAPSPIRTLSV